MKYKNLLLLGLILSTINSLAQTVTDFDGNTYNTINIGSQTWMKENLKTTHFNNGIIIPTTTSSVAVDSTSLFQWAYNNDNNNINVYGRLYTWFTIVNNNNVCPTGWHVPNNLEWETLSNFLGGDTMAGSKMKEIGIAHWTTTDSSVDNSSFFSGLPGGFRANPIGFVDIGSLGSFWSATPFGTSSFQRGECYNLQSFNDQFLNSVAVANCGLSVRCLRNTLTNIENIGLKNEIQIFPNPTINDINILFKNSQIKNLFIYSMDGKLLVQEILSNTLNTISLAKLERGLYFLRIVGEDYEIERKFIKD
jgi:uncharacterized protein (TIGR02145 family)